MSQPTAARVYIDGGPVVKLALPYHEETYKATPDTEPETTRVYMTQDEMQKDVYSRLRLGAPVEGTTTDGEGIVIPAGRVIDVVFPLFSLFPEEEHAYYGDAESVLVKKGWIQTAIGMAGTEYVEAFLSNSGFGGEVLIQTKTGNSALIVGFDDKSRRFVLDYVGRGDSMRRNMVPLENISYVLCWETEDFRLGNADSALTEVGRNYMASGGIPREELGLRT